MRKKLTATFFSILFYSILICGALGLVSCKSDTAHESQISFSIPKEVIRRTAIRAEKGKDDLGGDIKDYSIFLSVKLVSPDEKIIQFLEEEKLKSEWDEFFNRESGNDGYEVRFENVVIGTELYVDVAILEDFAGEKDETYRGKSSLFIIKEGENSISVQLKEVKYAADEEGTIDSDLEYAPLTVEINKAELSVFGDTIELQTKDEDGNIISDVDYEVSLFYNGTKLDSDYLKRTGSEVKIEELEAIGRYRIYVVAIYMKEGVVPVIGTQSFDVDVILPTELYVSSEGNEANSGLSADNTVPSLESACKLIGKYSFKSEELIDWTINVSGILNEHQILDMKKAKTITIQGVSNAEINANANEDNQYSTIEIKPECCPVIIRNITITGGYSYNGGGIYAESDLTIGDGVLITGNHATSCGGGIYSNSILKIAGGVITNNIAEYGGGGVYSEIEMYMYGDAVIGDREAIASAVYDLELPENNSYGNLCLNSENSTYSGGGGVNCKRLYLGYSGKDNEGHLIEAELSGGIYHNYAVYNGGGIYIDSWNNMSMNSGNIAYNSAAEKGNGIWLTSRDGALGVSGTAEISATNDVYLDYQQSGSDTYSACIVIEGALSKESVATITPGTYTSFQILKISEEVTDIEINDVKSKFTINGDGGYFIDNDGYLTTN